MLPRDIDHVTFEVIRNAFDSLVDEMALTVMRTAHSGVVKDAMDYATVLCDRNGLVIAQGLTVVQMVNVFPDAIGAVLTRYGGAIEPGDIFIANDPYGSGGSHLPDIYVIKPIFVDGTMEGFSGVTAHQADVGGMVPGSNSTQSTEIYQEGLRIPTLKLYEQGVPSESVFDIIEKNVRVPKTVLGDIRAQVAATAVGEREYGRLAARYGTTGLRRLTDAIIDYSERVVRAEIRDLPDGTYKFTNRIDGDNIESGPVTVQVAVTVDGDKLVVDFEGSSPQVKAGINSVLTFTRSATFGAVRMVIDPTVPNSAGCYRPIEVRAREGSVVNPRLPGAVGARGITGYRIVDSVLGALAQAVPDRIPAEGEGGNTIISIGGYNTKLEPFAYVDLFAGARGGGPKGDGVEGLSHPAVNISNTPVEIAEVELPVRIEEYSIEPDSGGAGKHRGALAQVRAVRCLAHEATLQLRSDKRLFPPYGLQGGRPGTPSSNILNPGDGEVILPTMGVSPMVEGDVIRHVMAGGGGWGDPMERDPELVREDVRSEKLSAAHARREYGVVVDAEGLQVDREATAALRERMRTGDDQASNHTSDA